MKLQVEGDDDRSASFLKRIAPRPNNALKAAAYSGQSETCRPKDLKL